MFNNLYFLIFCFELTSYLILWLIVSQIPVKHKIDSAFRLFKSSLPLTIVLLSGVSLLSASVGSVDLKSIQHYLTNAISDNDSVLRQSIPALAIILIITGMAFRMGTLPINFQNRVLLNALPYWLTILFTLISVCVGAVFLVLFVNTITVFDLGFVEQTLFFIALILLASTAGLLLIEKELKVVFVLIIMQIAGVFFAQLSVACWKSRHNFTGGESVSILDMMNEFSPMIGFSFLAVMGLACLLDSLSTHQSVIRYQDQLQGLIYDQRLLGGAALILLATLMGFPGLSVFRLKWRAIQSLFAIHQEQSTGALATMHTGYLGLAVLVLISSAVVAFVCAKLMMQISFARPLGRYRLSAQNRMAFFFYCCVIGSLIFNLRKIANL